MSRFEQYEVWVFTGARWEMAAFFADIDVANAVARGRNQRVRLIHAVYEGSKRVQEEILAEVGATRDKP